MPAGCPFATRCDQMIFQDPHSSLDPRMKVVDLAGEGLAVRGGTSRREREDKVAELLGIVGLRKEHLHRYPHEFSGGQRQRIGIARALMPDHWAACHFPGKTETE